MPAVPLHAVSPGTPRRAVRPSHGTERSPYLRLVRERGIRPPRVDPESLAVVRSLGDLMESSDRYTFGHCERVADYAVGLARVLSLSETEITTVRLGAYLHDLGKVHVPSSILNKPGNLEAEELAVIREHPSWGVTLLSAVGLSWDVEPMVRWHHERCDGSGYPDGLSGDEIPLVAQIIGIVDTFDALTTTRSYRPAGSAEHALAELWRTRRFWHPDVYAAFLTSLTLRAGQSPITPWRRRMARVESIGSA